MSGWKRVKDCLVCGRPRCIENEWMIYCFRDNCGYNKKQMRLGVGIPKDLVLRREVLGGRSPSNQLGIKFEDSEILKDELHYF